VSNVAWLNVGENASLADVLQVVGDIIHHFLAYYSRKSEITMDNIEILKCS
jgi:hypothetical protein